jgi:type IV secretory pathway TrbF-like protein
MTYPFRRATRRYGTTPEPATPYQKAAQVWDERLGSARVQARSWRLGFFGILAVLAVVATDNARLRFGTTVVPWIVRVDRIGHAEAVGRAERWETPHDAEIAWHLAQWIEWVRAVPIDPVVVRQNWLRAYDYTTDKGAIALNEYARAVDPFAHVGQKSVAVEVSSVIRASDSSFRVAWTERHYDNGSLAATERWSAILTLVIQPPRTAEALRKNPLGIYIHGIAWSRELSPGGTP